MTGLLHDLLDDQGLKALVVVAHGARDPYLAPFVGAARVNDALLVAPRHGAPRLGYFSPMERDEAAATGLALLTPEALDLPRWRRDGGGPVDVLTGALGQALQRSGVAPGRVALAGHADVGTVAETTARLATDGWTFVDGGSIVQRLRKKKQDDDLDEMRRVARGTAEAFFAIASLLRAARADGDGVLGDGNGTLTVGRARSCAAVMMAEHRLEQPAGNIVAPAEEGAVPHTTGTDDRALHMGESIIVDLFPRGRLFADFTRTFCVGPPSEALASAHADVQCALRLARSRCRPGVRGWALQEAVCDHFAAAGHPTPISHPGTERGYVHGLGHGVGFEVHEQPSFGEHAGDDGLVENRDVVTLEPGLYEPEAGHAVRLEDLCLVTETGIEDLVSMPYDLDPHAWSI